jgi:hypothetical protein
MWCTLTVWVTHVVWRARTVWVASVEWHSPRLMARFRYLILDSWTRARSGGMEHSHYLTRFRTVVLFWLMTRLALMAPSRRMTTSNEDDYP